MQSPVRQLARAIEQGKDVELEGVYETTRPLTTKQVTFGFEQL